MSESAAPQTLIFYHEKTHNTPSLLYKVRIVKYIYVCRLTAFSYRIGFAAKDMTYAKKIINHAQNNISLFNNIEHYHSKQCFL